ncbi:DUF895 domain membrane protein [Borealophlyctis nickersoniae]|nr:DUF895 domain membrane protein [Borealophlyctis nickersoniae]
MNSNVSQAFLTTLFPTIGLISLATLYGFFALGSIIAPRVGEKLGLKWAMVAGGTGYVVFIAALNGGVEAGMLLASLVVGICAGILWINQGAWVSRVGKKSGGTMTGLFFTICNLNGIIGNSIALLILYTGLGTDAMLWFMLLVGAVGCIMLAFADPMAETPVEDIGAFKRQAVSGGDSLVDQVKGMWKVAAMRRSVCLAPAMVLQGCNLAFTFGKFPTVVGPYPARVAEAFLCFGKVLFPLSYVVISITLIICRHLTQKSIPQA